MNTILQNLGLHNLLIEIIHFLPIRKINRQDRKEIYYTKFNSKDGPYKYYYETSEASLVTISSGEAIELSNSNGKLSDECFYKNGKLHGHKKRYYDTGEIMEKKFYKDNKVNGPCKYYYKTRFASSVNVSGFATTLTNGKLWEDCFYKNGKPNGPYKLYYESGKLCQEGSYKNGLKEGPYKFYDKDGNVDYEGFYKDGLFKT